eukprot:4416110-Pyramimonas_sp.AAC.1
MLRNIRSACASPAASSQCCGRGSNGLETVGADARPFRRPWTSFPVVGGWKTYSAPLDSLARGQGPFLRPPEPAPRLSSRGRTADFELLTCALQLDIRSPRIWAPPARPRC